MKNDSESLRKFSEVMWGTAEDFGGVLSENGVRMRFRAMQEYSTEQITQAGTWLLKNRTEKFPAVPTTKEFIDAIRGLQGEIVSTKVIARQQCDIVLKYFYRNWTPYNSYTHTFKDHITDYLMRNQWSFHRLGTMVLDDMKWFPKNFIDAYLDYSSEVDSAKALVCDLDHSDRVEAKELSGIANSIVKKIE